jgi:hypothetical protein
LEDSGWDLELDTPEEEQTEEGTLPHGVKSILPKVTLTATGKPLYVPETQDHGVFTEDMILEQQEIFAKLGTDEEAQKLRAKLQAAPLLAGKIFL